MQFQCKVFASKLAEIPKTKGNSHVKLFRFFHCLNFDSWKAYHKRTERGHYKRVSSFIFHKKETISTRADEAGFIPWKKRKIKIQFKIIAFHAFIKGFVDTFYWLEGHFFGKIGRCHYSILVICLSHLTFQIKKFEAIKKLILRNVILQI